MQGEPGRCLGAFPLERVEDGSLAPAAPEWVEASDGPVGSNGKRMIQKEIGCEVKRRRGFACAKNRLTRVLCRRRKSMPTMAGRCASGRRNRNDPRWAWA